MSEALKLPSRLDDLDLDLVFETTALGTNTEDGLYHIPLVVEVMHTVVSSYALLAGERTGGFKASPDQGGS